MPLTLPLLIPLTRHIDLDEDVGRFSVFTRLEGCVTVMAPAGIKPGKGRATVDGVALSRWEAVPLRGVTLLFLPLGEAAPDYERACRVTLEGFETPSGRRYPRRTFQVHTLPRRQPDAAFDDHDKTALEAAREGIVLLRNQNAALPLAPGETLNCLGRAQHWWRSSAAGASKINPRWRPSFLQAVVSHSDFRLNEELSSFFRGAGGERVPDADMLQRARALSDAALVFIGRQQGEMMDSRDIEGEYRLDAGEIALLQAARTTFKRLVVVLNTGGPVAMDWMREIDPDAILFTGYAGMLGARALVEILNGRVNPSGHVPDTWPWRDADNPVSRNFPSRLEGGPFLHEDEIGVRVHYEEDIYLGYRYFDTFGVDAAFPFGHGLSYTTFDLVPEGINRHGDTAIARVRVRNTGDVAGKAVAQLYVSPPEGQLEKPAHALAGFEKTALLSPGDETVLEIETRLDDWASFDEDKSAYVLEAGAYRLSVGQSVAALAECGAVTLAEPILRPVQHYGAPVEPIARLSKANPTVDGSYSRMVPLGEHIAVAAAREHRREETVSTKHGGKITWPRVVQDPALLDAFVSQFSLLDLCRLNVCAGARWMPWQDGMAGYTPQMKGFGLPSFTASDANAGLNLKRPNIGFPASSVIAATFNREIARSVGRVVAEECPAHGVSLVLGPGMNLHRSPRCGRQPEYFSEDPYLTGEMAGWHGKGLEENGVGCCYKHLFCNNTELGRLGSHSVVSERALRELYFRAFQIAFRVQKPSSVMTSYNALNGLYPGENPALLQGLLREEWGFDGFAMSDWSSTRTVDAVEMAKAGISWITPGGPRWVSRLYRAARAGRVTRAELERNVRWLLKGFMRT